MGYKKKFRNKLAMALAVIAAASAGTFAVAVESVNAFAAPPPPPPSPTVVTTEPSAVGRYPYQHPDFFGGIFNGLGVSLFDAGSGTIKSIDANGNVSDSAQVSLPAGFEIITGDFDGDGETDFASDQGSPLLPVFLQRRQTWDGGSGPGTFTSYISNRQSGFFDQDLRYVHWIPGDFNRDGKTDIAMVAGAADSGLTSIKIAFSDGVSGGTVNFHVTSFFAPDFSGWASSANVTVTPGDFNGDGRTDLALTGAGYFTTIPVAFSNGDGTFTITNASSPYFTSWATTPGVHVIAGHFDAGHPNRTGLALVGASGSAGWYTIPLATSNGDGTFTISNNEVGGFAGWAGTPGVKIVPSDLSFDGLTDLALTGVPGWASIPMARSTGDGRWAVTNSYSPAFASWASAPNVTVVGAQFELLLVGGDGWHTLPRAFSFGNGDFDVTNLSTPATRRFAYWAQQSPSSNDVPVAIAGSGILVSTHKNTQRAGDCYVFGQTGKTNATITLTFRSPLGDVDVHWHADMSTGDSIFGDVWHAHFNFKNEAGNQVGTVSLDGPRMWPPGTGNPPAPKAYHVDRYTTIHIDPTLFSGITNVDWQAEC